MKKLVLGLCSLLFVGFLFQPTQAKASDNENQLTVISVTKTEEVQAEKIITTTNTTYEEGFTEIEILTVYKTSKSLLIIVLCHIFNITFNKKPCRT